MQSRNAVATCKASSYQTPRGAAKFSKRGPTKSSAARENPGFFYADYAWREVFCDTSGYCDRPQSNAVKDELFPALILRRGAARRSLQCSPCYDKRYCLSFFNARRGAARRPVEPCLNVKTHSLIHCGNTSYIILSNRIIATKYNVLRICFSLY